MELLMLLIGAGILAFPVYVLVRLSELNAQVRQLRQEVDRLIAQSEAAAPEPRQRPLGVPVQPRPSPPPPPAPEPVVTPPAPPAPEPVVTVTPPPPAPERVIFEVPPPAVPSRPAPVTPVAARPPRPPAGPAFSLDVEELVGANWPAKLGIAAIAIAAAFFLKYAIDRGWIVPEARVAIGIGVAGAFYGLGQWLLSRPKYRRYAQALASGGVVIFFLSIWAAYSLYQLIDFSTAYGILAVAALATSALAVRNDTQMIGVLCLLGAYATPVLIRQAGAGGPDMLRLYAYLFGVDLWALLLVRFRPWYSLLALAFGATWIIFFGAGHLHGGNYWAVEGFAALFLLFSAYSGLKAVAAKPEEGVGEAGLAMLLLSLLAFGVASAAILAEEFLIGVPMLALVGAATALGLSVLPAAIRGDAEMPAAARAIARVFASIALGLMVAITIGTAPAVSAAQAPAAFAFGLCCYLLFLVAAVYMGRDEKGTSGAVLLLVVNAVAHLVLVYHALPALRIFTLSFAPLWLPVAGWLTLLALPFAPRQKDASVPATLMLVAQGLTLLALPGAGATLARLPSPAVPLAVFAGEFALISLTWTILRKHTVYDFRGDVVGAVANAGIFSCLFVIVAGWATYHGLVILCGCALGLAAYHAVIGAFALRGRGEDALLRLTFVGLALSFATIAIPLQLRATALTVAWAAESVVLVWAGMAAKDRRLRWYGLVLLIITGLKALGLDLVGSEAPARLLLNSRLLSGLFVALAAALSGYLMWREREHLSQGERAAPLSAILSGVCLALAYISVDLWQFLGTAVAPENRPAAQQFALTALWCAGAIAMLLSAPRLPAVRYLALVLLSFAGLKAVFVDLGSLSAPDRLFTNPRALSGLVVAAAAAAASYLLWRVREALPDDERSLPLISALSGVCVALGFMSVDLWQYLPLVLPVPVARGMQHLALTVLWSAAAVALVSIGARVRSAPTWTLGLVVLGLAFSKVALFDLLLAPEPFRLLGNARFLSGAVVVIAGYVVAWAMPREEVLVTSVRPPLLVLVNLLTLIAVSLDLWDYFGRVWQGPEHSSAQQLALSIFWSLYALVVLTIGIWRRLRPARLFAMGLLYLSIGKVFLLDLRFLATPYRIVSFLGLGVVLLLVSLMYTRFEEWLRAAEA